MTRRGSAREAVALGVVADRPDITAAALAEQLSERGHPVSTRTAQRIRQSAREELFARSSSPVSGAASAEPALDRPEPAEPTLPEAVIDQPGDVLDHVAEVADAPAGEINR